VAPGFTAAVPVLPGHAGPSTEISGVARPAGPQQFAPRIGIAWKPKQTVVRAGYGINYNLAQYGTMIQNLRFNRLLRTPRRMPRMLTVS